MDCIFFLLFLNLSHFLSSRFYWYSELVFSWSFIYWQNPNTCTTSHNINLFVLFFLLCICNKDQLRSTFKLIRIILNHSKSILINLIFDLFKKLNKLIYELLNIHKTLWLCCSQLCSFLIFILVNHECFLTVKRSNLCKLLWINIPNITPILMI